MNWDSRGNLTREEQDGYANVYSYDLLNRLQNAYEGGPVEMNAKASGQVSYGMRTSDVGGRKSLEYGTGEEIIRFDYYATSVGMNLGATRSVNKARLNAVGERLAERTVELYVSASGTKGSWKKLDDVTQIRDKEGITFLFKEGQEAQCIKAHTTWDERDEEYEPNDRHTVTGRVDGLFDVWYTREGKETTWSYDSLGNRLSEMVNIGTTESEAYEYYDNTNRVKSCHGWKYSYDANGNLVAKGTSGAWDETVKAYEYENGRGEVYKYRYDLLNRLVGVEHSESGTEGLTTIATYGYDMRDLRVSSTVKGTKTLRQYDLAGNLIWEDREDLDRRYVIALGGIWAESEIEGGNERTYWHHVDHLGTTEAITDKEGEVVWEANYGAFGEVLMSNGSKSFEPSYTGKEWESAIGLYYFNARWYDPNLGRFITEDPARDGENWYGYCENNPLNRIDPTGLESVPFATSRVTEYFKTIKDVETGSPIGNVFAGGVAGLWNLGANSVNEATDITLNALAATDEAINFAWDNTIGRLCGGISLADAAMTTAVTIPGQNIDDAIAHGYYALHNGLSRFSTLVKAAAPAAGKGGTTAADAVVHGNSLSSTKPTWGYKLFSEDGIFLKNGITSKTVPETRYTKSFMQDKFMEKQLFPNRRAAYDWEFGQNKIQRGPLNLNMH